MKQDLASTIERKIESETIQSTLNELPEKYKSVLILYYMEDSSYQEIAAEDSENARLAAIKADNENPSQERFEVIEMRESGQTIAFALSAEEIAAEDAEVARLVEFQAAK